MLEHYRAAHHRMMQLFNVPRLRLMDLQHAASPAAGRLRLCPDRQLAAARSIPQQCAVRAAAMPLTP
jgi:hypothetical protein